MEQGAEKTMNSQQIDFREKLAEYAHSAWSGWMVYMLGKGALNPDGSLTLPPQSVERWTRQMNTPYADLPESEKVSDGAEADKMIAIISENSYWY